MANKILKEAFPDVLEEKLVALKTKIGINAVSIICQITVVSRPLKF